MKNTFHSNGTANGMVEMMNVWSIQIETIAIHVSHGHGENSSTAASPSRRWCRRCGRAKWVSFDGRRSFG